MRAFKVLWLYPAMQSTLRACGATCVKFYMATYGSQTLKPTVLLVLYFKGACVPCSLYAVSHVRIAHAPHCKGLVYFAKHIRAAEDSQHEGGTGHPKQAAGIERLQ